MRVLICDDQAIIRDGLEMLIKLERDIDVVGKAEDGSRAIELATALQPDLVLMDLKMPGMNGVEATRTIRERFPHIKILILTTYDDDEWVLEALRAGACGYLLKDMPRQGVIRALRGTIAGGSWLDPNVAGKLVKQVRMQTKPAAALTDKLTDREVDVLRLVARGLNNADIARQLVLSEGTVRNYVSSIMDKLGLADRTQVAVLALQHGLGKE